MHTTIRRGQETFPRSVTSVEELPAAVLRALDHHGAADDLSQLLVIPPQTFMAPRMTGPRRLFYVRQRTPQRTLAFGATQMLVVEETEADELNVIAIPTADLVSVQIDRVLLYSYFVLSWIASGELQRITVEYNSVADKQIGRGLERAQQALIDRHAPGPDGPPEPFSTRDFPLKFRNFARSSRMPGEDLRFAIYEPRVRKPLRERLASAGQPYQVHREPNRVIMLTDYRLIVIEDRLPHTHDQRKNKYRVNRVFYPRARVLRTHLETCDEATWLCLTIGTAEVSQEAVFPLSEANLTALRRELDRWFLLQND